MGRDGNLGLKPQAVMECAFGAGWDLGAGCNVAAKWDFATSDGHAPGRMILNPPFPAATTRSANGAFYEGAGVRIRIWRVGLDRA